MDIVAIKPCIVEYCNGEGTPTLGCCKKHVKAWHKAGEPVGDALAPWLMLMSDEELDVCLTPPALALEICRVLQRTLDCGDYGAAPKILEPSAGDGAFVNAARNTWPESDIVAIEIRPECKDKLILAGATRSETWSLEQWLATDDGKSSLGDADESADLVIGNPPFAFAEPHIRMLLDGMKEGAHLVFLLRLGFYESHERIPFWRECPEKFFAPIVPRPGFKLNKQGKPGSDSQAYGVFIWQKGWTGPSTRLPHIVWQEKRVGRLTRGRDKPVAAKKVESKVEAAPELET